MGKRGPPVSPGKAGLVSLMPSASTHVPCAEQPGRPGSCCRVISAKSRAGRSAPPYQVSVPVKEEGSTFCRAVSRESVRPVRGYESGLTPLPPSHSAASPAPERAVPIAVACQCSPGVSPGLRRHGPAASIAWFAGCRVARGRLPVRCHLPFSASVLAMRGDPPCLPRLSAPGRASFLPCLAAIPPHA